MATSIAQENSTSSGSIIAGYFASGEDAHRAINALLDEGFLPNQIGAAFHSAGAGSTGAAGEAHQVLGGNTMRESLGTTLTDSKASDNTLGGPASDDSAVQPAGIATGTGSPFLGVGKPGPISGSSLAHTGLPSELEHDLPSSTAAGSAPAGYSAAPVAATPVTAEPQHPVAPAADQSWGAKLKHLFSSDHPATPTHTTTSAGTSSAGTSTATAESQNFGSGSGSLGIAPPYGRPYVAGEFERSVAGAGVAPEHSQQLSRRLSGGGAVVTVSATGRAVEVEKIFERHHGHVRFASGVFEDVPVAAGSGHVEVFGHLEHLYAGPRR